MYEDEKRTNRITALKKAGINIIGGVCLVAILIIIFKNFFPDFLSLKNKIFQYFLSFLFVFIVYKNFVYYKKIVKFLDDSSYLRKKKRECDSREYIKLLNSAIMNCNHFKEVIKMKIDILKSLAPLPVLVFILGLIIEDKLFKILNLTFSNSISLSNLTIEQITVMIVIASLFYYIYEFRTTFVRYKEIVADYYRYKERLEDYKSELVEKLKEAKLKSTR